MKQRFIKLVLAPLLLGVYSCFSIAIVGWLFIMENVGMKLA